MTNQQGAPEAPRGTAADGKTELFNVTGYPLMVRAVDFNRLHAENERLAALAEAQQPACGNTPYDEGPFTLAQQPAPSAAGAGNSGFDYQTAADLLNGKTVSDEVMRKFVAASCRAHDDRVGLRATLLSVRGEQASREAEIALLKKALMDAEASQPSPTPQADSVTAPAGGAVMEPTPVTDADVRDMSARVISGQAEEDELVAFFERLVPPRPVRITHEADSVLEDAARWQELREQHESDEVLCCVFAPNDMRECLVPVGSLPGELDAFMDAERAARKQGGA